MKIVLAAMLFSLPICGLAQKPQQPSPQTIDNLVAFAKLYGYIRYFHPSDEAASINWNQFAM